MAHEQGQGQGGDWQRDVLRRLQQAETTAPAGTPATGPAAPSRTERPDAGEPSRAVGHSGLTAGPGGAGDAGEPSVGPSGAVGHVGAVGQSGTAGKQPGVAVGHAGAFGQGGVPVPAGSGARRGEPALRLVHPPRSTGPTAPEPGQPAHPAAPLHPEAGQPTAPAAPVHPAPSAESAFPAPGHPATPARAPLPAPVPAESAGPAPVPTGSSDGQSPGGGPPAAVLSAAAGQGPPAGGSPVPGGSRDPRLPASAPESVPTVDPRLARALGRPQHGDSITRRTGRSLRRLTASAAQDVTEETRIARELQQPVTTGRVIAVTSIRGGVGKSTVSALLGRTFNHYRHDPVLTLEADAALGTLPVRMGAESVRWACADLAQVLSPSMRLNDVTGYLVPVADGGWLLPASRGRVGAPLDVPTYRTVTLALRRYFAVTVVDCESLPGEVARTAMDTAHARVVVSPTTAEGVNGTRQVLNWLAQLPHAALASTVVALTAGSPDLVLDVKAATAHLKETGVTVVPLPYDRHLAGGGPIRTDLLGQATRDATVRLAAEAMRRATRVR
ncbi:hypothetical protein [Streptomyces sp. NPDC005907]|uniref:hypothetical protein n=1 Tax=Streptomyces sp. NPDC005907 TaxID=3154571 RepID=UPI003406FE45